MCMVVRKSITDAVKAYMISCHLWRFLNCDQADRITRESYRGTELDQDFINQLTILALVLGRVTLTISSKTSLQATTSELVGKSTQNLDSSIISANKGHNVIDPWTVAFKTAQALPHTLCKGDRRLSPPLWIKATLRFARLSKPTIVDK